MSVDFAEGFRGGDMDLGFHVDGLLVGLGPHAGTRSGENRLLARLNMKSMSPVLHDVHRCQTSDLCSLCNTSDTTLGRSREVCATLGSNMQPGSFLATDTLREDTEPRSTLSTSCIVLNDEDRCRDLAKVDGIVPSRTDGRSLTLVSSGNAAGMAGLEVMSLSGKIQCNLRLVLSTARSVRLDCRDKLPLALEGEKGLRQEIVPLKLVVPIGRHSPAPRFILTSMSLLLCRQERNRRLAECSRSGENEPKPRLWTVRSLLSVPSSAVPVLDRNPSGHATPASAGGPRPGPRLQIFSMSKVLTEGYGLHACCRVCSGHFSPTHGARTGLRKGEGTFFRPASSSQAPGRRKPARPR
mmetsp:Transcript_86424/g.241796  ORF Transcript_86424/g.241796 Transcript_86424/m.241796 type:complete len:354 (-) Transcript_86424:683-1744(-)